jgi:DNA-binding response OmpR family regulator
VSKKILVVDDSSSNILLLQNFFEDEGYDVETSEGGKVTLKKIKNFEPDVILLDLMMPKINGFEMFELIKADSKSINIPVIFITANKDKAERIKAMEMGAKDYFTKPLNFDEILSSVDNIIHNGNGKC